VLIVVTIIFVFFATLQSLRSGDGGWRDWHWPGSGDREGLFTALKCKSDLARDARPLSSLNTSFRVPANIAYDSRGPRADQIVILTATDGGGHNDAIPEILEQTTSNRKAYCAHQGYRYHFVNISKFDLDGAHPVWKKLPAIVDAFNTYPDAQWVWMLDLDAIIMTPTVDLRDILLSKKGMERGLDFRAELHQSDWKTLGMWMPEQDHLDFEGIDFLIAQDHNGVNAGSFFVRRSNFSKFFLDMWGDPFFRKMNWEGQEQDALVSAVSFHHGYLPISFSYNLLLSACLLPWYLPALLAHLDAWGTRANRKRAGTRLTTTFPTSSCISSSITVFSVNTWV